MKIKTTHPKVGKEEGPPKRNPFVVERAKRKVKRAMRRAPRPNGR